MRALRPAKLRNNRYGIADLLSVLILARLYQGNLEGASQALAEAPPEFLEGAATLPKVDLRRAEAELLLALGEVERAAARYDDFTTECASIIQAPVWLRVEVAQLGLRLALAQAATGDARGIRRARALEKSATDGASPARLARSLRHLAELDLCSGNSSSARFRLAAAEAALQRQHAPLEAACLLARQAILNPARAPQAKQAFEALHCAHPSVFERWAW